LSACNTDCTYNINAAITPEVTSFSEETYGIQLDLNVPTGSLATVPTQADITVTYGGLPCTIFTVNTVGTVHNVLCNMP
jgi:hypothetical protein